MTERHRLPCRTVDPDLFFPVGHTGPAAIQAEQAKALCARCPIWQECLAHALAMNVEFGVWGGKTELERRSLLRRGVGASLIGRTVETRHGLVRELASA